MKNINIENEILFESINPIDFYGVNNANLNLIKAAYPDVKFIARGNTIKTIGDPERLNQLAVIIGTILAEIKKYGAMEDRRVIEIINANPRQIDDLSNVASDVILHGTSGNPIRARTEGQRRMVEACEKEDLVFAIGPAGSGKTYTAVALAVRALKNKWVRKIILCRPAVEAGERLGFLPGDLKEKIDPYLRPLYDALEDMIHAEKLKAFMERNTIEIAPLAYMRGRTLNNAFIILDEAQNATEIQLKMFLTRMGIGSKVIITGDQTQIDLPKTQKSGLLQCIRILKDVEGIQIVFLSDKDVVRHPVIKRILKAYEQEDDRIEKLKELRKAEKKETL